MLVYLMLFAALFNAVCLYNSYFLPLIFANVYVFMLCVGLLTHSLFVSNIICIMLSSFNLSVVLILCSHRFLVKGLCALWRNNSKK